MNTGLLAPKPNLAPARDPETKSSAVTTPRIQFSPASLRHAADTAFHVVRNSNHDYDEANEEEIIDGDCADLLAAEFLRDMRADAPAFLMTIATSVAEEWMERVVYQDASRHDLMELFGHYQDGFNYDVELKMLAEGNVEATRERVRKTLPGALTIWDGKLAQTKHATELANTLARVNEQIAEQIVPLRAKIELMARIFGSMSMHPDECGGKSEDELIADVLHEYGLERPEAEPRARARP